MEFRIADTFTDSLAKLTGEEQKAVKTAAFDLQLNPAHPSLQFHKLDKPKDRRFWSIRVNSDVRLIVHRTDSSLLLCYPCEFFRHCNADPPPNHISCLPRLSEKKRRDLTEQGFTLIHKIPDDFPLTEIQSRVWTAVKTSRPWVNGTLHQEMATLNWPLYFMDFESLYPAIPRFAGMWPYSQIPFQWSVHLQMEPDGGLEHFEFLADDEADPRLEFIDSLCEALGARGQIVVYNASFEARRLHELSGWLPEYAGRIEKIQQRMWDLLPFVKRHVYHPQFNGSYSIKAVLPALVPEMTYEGMEVAHGEAAGLAWDRMVRGGVVADERQRLKSALLAYCSQDTLAMAKLLDRLKALGTSAGPRDRNSLPDSAGLIARAGVSD